MTPVEVVLEPLAVEHLAHVMTWVNDREVMQYFATRQTHIGEEDERRYIESLVASKNDRAWSVFDTRSHEYVGQCSINQIYWPAKNGRLFVVVTKAKQRQGYGRAVVEAVLARAWEELGLHKVWLIVRRDNRAAQAMYVRLGFEFEGVLRDEYCITGASGSSAVASTSPSTSPSTSRWFDMVRMGVLRP